MSSSGLIYAVIVGAWAAYLVPMWLRRQDELNEARPTERFSTAIRLLSGRAGMERRYARDLRARSTQEGSRTPVTRTPSPTRWTSGPSPCLRRVVRRTRTPGASHPQGRKRHVNRSPYGRPSRLSAPPQRPVPAARRGASAQAAAARDRRLKVLARRRRTTVMLFLGFTLGAIVAAVGGLAFLWAPAAPAVMLSGYIAYLRSQERRRFAYQMDRRRAEVAAQRLRERERQPRRRVSLDQTSAGADEAEEVQEAETDPGLSALAADRRALVEQTDHAEWVDQQRERQRRPGGDSWEPVPVPLPTYVTAPVAPRATSDVDLGAPDTWSSARSSSVAPEQEAVQAAEADADGQAAVTEHKPVGGRSDARRAASARRARERGRTPLFDQYEDGDRPRAANE
ncbi:divisome protein SepX/GlpR [Streptomyces lasalocidi]